MYKPGTIVLIPFPFTDSSGSKIRPALVVSRLIPGDDVIAVFISSKSSAGGKFDVAATNSKSNGLKVPSVIKCSKIATLDKKMILGELGILESKIMGLVSKNLKQILV